MLKNNIILIIGGTGSLGNILTKYLYNDNKIIILSRDENKQWSMKINYPTVTFVLGDMRNIDSISMCIRQYKPDIVIIAGALKHIDICEYNISECIETNILGTRNIIDSVINLSDYHKIDTVLFISTDKSCSPVNVYGMSKSISERLIIAASLKKLDTKFVCVRYGNVLNSRGSLIPKFKDISEDANHLYYPITDDKMTRFFMTLDESFNLILNAIKNGTSGDIWVPKINAYKIKDIAIFFSNKYNKPIKNIDIRPGEKIHECLINQSETNRTLEIMLNDKIYYVIKPCYIENIKYQFLTKEYTSEETTNINNLIKFL